MKILVATEKPFAPVAIEGIRRVADEAGHELALLEKYTSAEELYAAVADADALIVRSDKVTAEVLAHAPKLKIVVRAGAGYDNVDLEAASKLGIVVENTPGQNSNAVAELVFGMLIMAVRNMYAGTSGSELLGKTLGIHAFGQVGRNVARIAQGFGMEVSAFDPYCPDEVMEKAGVRPIHDLPALYSENKFVSLHIPATPETRRSVGFDLITRLPQGGVLINTARKEVIDEEGLKKALAERPDLKYVADIAPDNAAELTAEFPGRVFFTPKKMGAQTSEANINAGIAAARQIAAFFLNGDTRFQVNK
ncbi:MAG: 3-phosphoglycerate dehydrogenase [Muribaculaceae bacterium]|nr:3-phosphoglycerate dehydrogenase [Muribaculaceae bacterium]